MFQKVTMHHKDWDEGYFAMAKYYEQMLQNEKAKCTEQLREAQGDAKAVEKAREREMTADSIHLPDIVKNFGNSLCYGSKCVRFLVLVFPHSASVPTCGSVRLDMPTTSER
jgi:hypothetical protein